MQRFTLSSSLSLLVFAAACGGSVDQSSVTSEPKESTPMKEATPSSPVAPDSLVGTYHLTQVDATNLQIRADGTYTWTIEGCDFGGGQCGTWRSGLGGTVILEADKDEMEWTHDGSFKQRVQTLRVEKDGTKGVTVQGITSDGQAFRQSWSAGRACAICGGNLGPTGQETCDAPLPDVCGW
jgi:hypothetical protein